LVEVDQSVKRESWARTMSVPSGENEAAVMGPARYWNDDRRAQKANVQQNEGENASAWLSVAVYEPFKAGKQRKIAVKCFSQ
jgi:hypothetical protein